MSRFGFQCLLLILFSNPCLGQTDFFWSFHNLGDGAENSDIEMTLSVGETATLYLYYSIANYEVSTGLGLDVASSSRGVIQFEAAESFEFDVAVEIDGRDFVVGHRWGDGYGAAGLVEADEILGLNAFTVVAGDGMIERNIGPQFVDQGYDFDAEAFLFGQVDFMASATGTTRFEITPWSSSICNNCSPWGPFWTFGSATIHVVPEPNLVWITGSLLGWIALTRNRKA